MVLSRTFLLCVVAAFAFAAADKMAYDGDANAKADANAPGEGSKGGEDGEEEGKILGVPIDSLEGVGPDLNAAPPAPFTEKELLFLHRMMDTDGNGKISYEEFQQFARERKAHVHRTGYQDRLQEEPFFEVESVEAHMKKYAATMTANHTRPYTEEMKRTVEKERQRMEASDVNKDGMIDRTEHFHHENQLGDEFIKVLVRHAMEEHDADKDGFLNFTEFLQEWSGIGSHLDQDGNLREHDHDIKMFTHLDLDGDKKISEDEMWHYYDNNAPEDQAAKQLIAHADKDGDGQLDVDELLKSGLQDDYWGTEENPDPIFEVRMQMRTYRDHSHVSDEL